VGEAKVDVAVGERHLGEVAVDVLLVHGHSLTVMA
jgi:hypothetical protein